MKANYWTYMFVVSALSIALFLPNFLVSYLESSDEVIRDKRRNPPFDKTGDEAVVRAFETGS